MNSNKFVVFSSVGDKNNAFKSWRKNQGNYLIAIAYYGNNMERANEIKKYCDIFFHSKGSKFQNFEKFDSQLDYDYILITDDDITFSAEKIDKCFEVMRKNNIDVASPSHSIFGRVSWIKMLSHLYGMRKTNFVEMTAIFMSKEATEKFLIEYRHYRDLIVGYGIDFMISYSCYEIEKPFYIFDSYCITNPRTLTREINRLQPYKVRKTTWEAIEHKFPIKKFQNPSRPRKQK